MGDGRRSKRERKLGRPEASGRSAQDGIEENREAAGGETFCCKEANVGARQIIERARQTCGFTFEHCGKETACDESAPHHAQAHDAGEKADRQPELGGAILELEAR